MCWPCEVTSLNFKADNIEIQAYNPVIISETPTPILVGYPFFPQ